MTKNEMLKDVLKIHDTFVVAVEAEYLTYDLEKLHLTRNTILRMYQELLMGSTYYKEEIELFELKKSAEKMVELISKVVDQLQIKENLNVSEMSEENLLQYLKEESINLDNGLIALLDIPLNSKCLESKNLIKTMIEGYILECDKNIEALKPFVEKGVIEDFSSQMELTEVDKNKLVEKLLFFCKWSNDNQSIFVVGVFDKLFAKTMNLLMRINNCKILPPKIVEKPQSDYEIIAEYLKVKQICNKI